MKALWCGGAVLLLTVTLVAGGCNNTGQVQRLQDRNSQLSKELSDLRAASTARDAELTAKDRKIGELQDSVNMLHDEIAKGPVRTPALPPDLQAALEQLQKSGTLISGIEGRHVRLEGDVLFDSGKADIKPAAKAQLSALADVIEQKGGLFQVRVEGNTDSDPIRKSNWKDNWQLSYARARAVLGALADAGVPEAKMFIAAYGMYQPRVPNDSAANKQQNRRVELVLIPATE